MTDLRTADSLLGLGAFSSLIVIAFPQPGLHIYVANFFLSAAGCGLFSAWILIFEKRVPPKQSGTIMILARSIGEGLASSVPIVSTLPIP